MPYSHITIVNAFSLFFILTMMNVLEMSITFLLEFQCEDINLAPDCSSTTSEVP